MAESRGLIGKTTRHLGLTLTPATFPIYAAILKSEAERAWKTYRMVVFAGLEFNRILTGRARIPNAFPFYSETGLVHFEGPESAR